MGLFSDWVEAVFPGINRREKLRKAWGLKGDKDGWLASRAFDLVRTPSQAQWLDDKTWTDLEFPSLFTNIDTTITPVGAQILYKQLREYQFDSKEIARRHEAYDAFKADSALREDCQLALAALDTHAAAHVADVILGSPRPVANYQPLIFILAFASVAALSLVIAAGASLWLWMGVLVANIAVITKMTGQIGRDTSGLLACWQMLNVADKLSSIRTGKQVPILRKLRAEQSHRRTLRRSIRWFALASGENTPLSGFAVLLNVCFLLKLITYIRSINEIAEHREHWKSTFESVGAVDAASAIANFMHRMQRHCRPTVSKERLISFADLFHPLLNKSVDCSVALKDRSALITGSNMTGKTTFVKSVAISIVLGHTLGICLASAATIPNSGVMTSIRSDHSVESGKSRYFSEVEAIKRMLHSLESNDCGVFVIDEPFSGTNTEERIAIAKAVLSAMGSQAQVLVTTHDVELQDLLADKFNLFHFREDPSVEGYFDYKLRTGASVERNAVKVLARMGFPDSIIESALKHMKGSAIDMPPANGH
jgi:predicted ATPase